MHTQPRAALAFLFVAIAPAFTRGAPQSPSNQFLNAKEVHVAEAEAKTARDHSRLAAYYSSQAQRTRGKLAQAEDMLNYWSKQPGMAGRTKVPNPYASARTLTERYRAELEKESKLAATHQKLAESLEPSANKPAQ